MYCQDLFAAILPVKINPFKGNNKELPMACYIFEAFKA